MVVGVAGDDALHVADLDDVPVAGLAPRGDDDAVAGGQDGGVHPGHDVHARVELAAAGEGGEAAPEGGSDPPLRGEDGGRVGQHHALLAEGLEDLLESDLLLGGAALHVEELPAQAAHHQLLGLGQLLHFVEEARPGDAADAQIALALGGLEGGHDAELLLQLPQADEALVHLPHALVHPVQHRPLDLDALHQGLKAGEVAFEGDPVGEEIGAGAEEGEGEENGRGHGAARDGEAPRPASLVRDDHDGVTLAGHPSPPMHDQDGRFCTLPQQAVQCPKTKI